MFNQYDIFYNKNIESVTKCIKNNIEELEEMNACLLKGYFLPFFESSLSSKNINQFCKYLSTIPEVIKIYFENKQINEMKQQIKFIINVYTQFIYWYISIYYAEQPLKINYNTSKTFFTKKLQLETWIDLYECYNKVKYYLFFTSFELLIRQFQRDLSNETFELQSLLNIIIELDKRHI